jgi:methylmalonyl-CoA mutase cobalamin-binding subunit
MVVPAFEDHSIGAFVAADQFRRHGLWVHMAIGLEAGELSDLAGSGRFAMIGVTSGSAKTLEPLVDLVDCLRADSQNRPPIVVGGNFVTRSKDAGKRIGADFVVRTAREAIERCGLASVAEPLSIDVGP